MLAKSDKVGSNPNLIDISLKMQDIKSSRYDNVEIDLDVQIAKICVNFQPLAFNRLLRFVRFVQYPKEVLA